MQLTHEAETRLAAGEPTELVVDGKTLTYILSGEKPTSKGGKGSSVDAAESREAEAKLAHLGSLCTAVVVCRASPSQKANIVSMMRQYELDLVQRDRKGPLGRWLAKLNRNLGVRERTLALQRLLLTRPPAHTHTARAGQDVGDWRRRE